MSYLKTLRIFALFIFMLAAPGGAFAQGGLQQQTLDLPRNPELETESKHNLDVAKFYIKKKAYKAVTDRLLEITYVYPQFSKMDEVLFLLGDAFLKLDKKAEAAKQYKRIVDEFPDSNFAKDAKKQLEALPEAEAKAKD